jgi:hypothetical protein
LNVVNTTPSAMPWETVPQPAVVDQKCAASLDEIIGVLTIFAVE